MKLCERCQGLANVQKTMVMIESKNFDYESLVDMDLCKDCYDNLVDYIKQWE